LYAPRQASRVRYLTDVEAAWLGAMLEGEGNITVTYRDSGHPRVWVAITNNEVEVISTCLRLVGDGTVTFCRNSRPNQHNTWAWVLRAKRAVCVFLLQVHPYLAGKKERAEAALELLWEECDV